MASSLTTCSDLIMDPLVVICKKLVLINDFKAFGAVCSNWRAALLLCYQHIPPQVPLLMLPNYDYVTHQYTVFSCPNFNRHLLHPTQFVFSYYYGSSHGWLITDPLTTRNTTLKLYNPFLSVNNVIQISCPEEEIRISEAVLSDDPSKTSNYAVTVIDYYHKLAFFKAGDKSWTRLDYNGHRNMFQCITCYNDQLYALSLSRLGDLVCCNINESRPSLIKIGSLNFSGVAENMYLVVSAGDLLVLQAKLSTDYKENVEFRVWKVETGKCKVVELKNLRGYAIFLSPKSCVSVSASEFPNCKPDHIYLSIYDYHDYNYDYSIRGKHVTIVYNFIDKKIVHRFDLHEGKRTSLVWIQPTLNMITSTASNEKSS